MKEYFICIEYRSTKGITKGLTKTVDRFANGIIKADTSKESLSDIAWRIIEQDCEKYGLARADVVVKIVAFNRV